MYVQHLNALQTKQYSNSFLYLLSCATEIMPPYSALCLSLLGSICLSVKGFNFQNKITTPLTNAVTKFVLPRCAVPILGSLIGIFLSPDLAAAAPELKTYSNPRYHTVLSYPADFEMKIGQISGDRDVVAFTDPTDPDTSASLVFSPIPAGNAILNLSRNLTFASRKSDFLYESFLVSYLSFGQSHFASRSLMIR